MERFGGFVAQVFGDGILVYFGYPTAHEHEAERAVRAVPGTAPAAAHTRHQRSRQDASQARGANRNPFRTRGDRSGVEVSAGISRHDVVGEAINLAARLQAEAPPGGIAISQETMELVEGLFALRSLGTSPSRGCCARSRFTKSCAPCPDPSEPIPPAPRRDADGGARDRDRAHLSAGARSKTVRAAGRLP